MIREAWAQKDENQKTAPQRRATVIKQYPHHVLVENAKGTRCCITNAEIYGTEKRKGVQEAAGKKVSGASLHWNLERSGGDEGDSMCI